MVNLNSFGILHDLKYLTRISNISVMAILINGIVLLLNSLFYLLVNRYVDDSFNNIDIKESYFFNS